MRRGKGFDILKGNFLDLRLFKHLLVICLSVVMGFLLSLPIHAGLTLGNFSHFYEPDQFSSQLVTSQLVTSQLVSSANSLQSSSEIQTGQLLYQAGRFAEAVGVWQRAIASLDRRHQALVYSYLALARQNLGQLALAQADMERALSLIKSEPHRLVAAQILNHYGDFLLNQGKLEASLQTWQQSQQLYQQLGDKIGVWGTQVNQARAWQALGMYRRARNQLELVAATLQQQPASSLQINSLISLGNVLRLTGGFVEAKTHLQRALSLAKQLNDHRHIQLALFHLGNVATAQQQFAIAADYYRQVIQMDAQKSDPTVKISAQVQLVGLLLQTQQQTQAAELIQHLQFQLPQQPLTQTTVYAQIELGEYLGQLGQFSAAAKLLATAVQTAKTLANPRAHSYALGKLAFLYEQTQQWSEAKQLTEQAMSLISSQTAPEIAYEWEWQMGRLLNATGDKQAAIIHYRQALNILRSLRQDLAVISQDVQFSFRDRVEPLYRQFVDLLLAENTPISPQVQQTNLIQARKTIEDLQLAELANFFRQACLDNYQRNIENIDTNAAVIYPIILKQRLEVILSLPGQPLHHYATAIPQSEVETDIQKMRQSLRRTSFINERQPIAQKIYTWLIQPIVPQLSKHQIKTLVFVLDGSLRNIPIAALFDGNHYLIENYQIAIAPSLQLFNPRPLKRDRLQVLLAGLSQASQQFTALPGVKQEIEQIQEFFRKNQLQRTSKTLIDRQFTLQALKQKITQSYSIIHLASHGQFSSNPENNFILTSNGKLDINTLDRLLWNRQLSDSPPIELLVLSACQTAQGDNRATLGLAGVAVRSGASTTLASLWTVNDTSTSQLMVKFYETLFTQGVSKAEALRQAQLYLLKHSQYSHPYFWASFVLVGSWI